MIGVARPPWVPVDSVAEAAGLIAPGGHQLLQRTRFLRGHRPAAVTQARGVLIRLGCQAEAVMGGVDHERAGAFQLRPAGGRQKFPVAVSATQAAPRCVVVVAKSSAVGCSSGLRCINPDDRSGNELLAQDTRRPWHRGRLPGSEDAPPGVGCPGRLRPRRPLSPSTTGRPVGDRLARRRNLSQRDRLVERPAPRRQAADPDAA
jgi:hypothetical protein